MALETFQSSAVTEEYWWTAEDGMKLFAKNWKPKDGKVKARMIAMHGFSDYCDNQGILFPTLTESGIAVYAWDGRGWGHSVHNPAQMGLTGPTTQVLKDIDGFINHIVAKTSSDLALAKTPLFLYGHSMGGAQCLVYASQGPASTRAHIRGYISASPLIALHPATRPWGITVLAGRLAAKILPKFHLHNQLKPELLGRDPLVPLHYVSDPLHHDMGTLEGLEGMLKRGEDLETLRIKITPSSGVRSVVVLHGTDDGITYFNASKNYVEKGIEIKDKKLIACQGSYHMVHWEPSPDKEKYCKDVIDWMLARLD